MWFLETLFPGMKQQVSGAKMLQCWVCYDSYDLSHLPDTFIQSAFIIEAGGKQFLGIKEDELSGRKVAGIWSHNLPIFSLMPEPLSYH